MWRRKLIEKYVQVEVERRGKELLELKQKSMKLRKITLINFIINWSIENLFYL